MSQRLEPTIIDINFRFGYSTHEASADLTHHDLEGTLRISLPTTLVVITSARGNRFNQARREAVDQAKFKELLTYDSEVGATPEPNKFSKPDLFRAMASDDCPKLRVYGH